MAELVLPTLYYKDPKGRLREWTVAAVGDKVRTRYGIVGGAMQTSEKTATAKNVGRANETDGEQQALLEALALWEHKRTRQYAESKEEAKSIPVVLPMKLQPYDKHKRKIKFPAYVQPKLDGFRAMAMLDPESVDEDSVIFLSRSGRIYHAPHLEKEILPILLDVPNLVLDGEFYLHEKLTFEQLSSYIKRYREGSEQIEFHVFDCALLNEMEQPFSYRFNFLESVLLEFPNDKVKLVETVRVYNEEHLEEFHEQYRTRGFEGSVVRNYSGVYRFNYRSYDAQKLKDFLDEEYKIVDYTNGVGKFENAVIWICETKDGKQFRVVPTGTFEERAAMLANANSYIGKMLTVSYLNLTADGIPRHPVGLRIREAE